MVHLSKPYVKLGSGTLSAATKTWSPGLRVVVRGVMDSAPSIDILVGMGLDSTVTVKPLCFLLLGKDRTSAGLGVKHYHHSV